MNLMRLIENLFNRTKSVFNFFFRSKNKKKKKSFGPNMSFIFISTEAQKVEAENYFKKRKIEISSLA